MPKIRITEKDMTTGVAQNIISDTVFMPVRLKADSSIEAGSIELYRNTEDFNKVFKGASKNQAESADIAMVNYLIGSCGFPVLVEAVKQNTEEMSKYVVDWNSLKDKTLYDIRFITSGFLTSNNTENINEMANVAAARGDCVALYSINEIADDFKYDASSVRLIFEGLGIQANGEYAAGFTPWFYTNIPGMVDNTGNPLLVPAAFGYLFAYANATKINPEWYAIAGYSRGAIPCLTQLNHKYGSSEIEVLQARAAGGDVELDDESDNTANKIAINPIVDIRPVGPVIFGNRTMKANTAEGTTAQSFLNIRNMLSAIKKTIYNACRKYQFEPNNQVLWINFESYITPLLDQMVAGNGLMGYRFTQEPTEAKARLKAKLKIVPVEAVEDFDIDIELHNSLEDEPAISE